MTAPSSRSVRLQPVPGEALESWVGRVADANLVPRRRRPTLDRGVRALPSRSRVADVSTWSGADRPATDLTLYAYPRGIRGRVDGTGVRDWRVNEATWVCPVCTPATGVWMRDWSLACHPLCLTCGSLLTDARSPAAAHPRRADRTTLDVQRRVSTALAAAGTRQATAPRWRAAYKLASLVSLTADDHWPRLPSWEADLRGSLDKLYGGWCRRPPADPAQAAWIVFEAWRGIESPVRGQRLIAEGWDRLLQHPDHDVRRVGDMRGVLPERPRHVLLPQRDAAAAESALKDMVRAVRRLQMGSGLEARHVPSWCITSDELAPAEQEWSTRARLAIVLHAVCSGAAGRRWSGERRAVIDLQLAGTGPSPIMLLLREGRGIAGDYADLVVSSADYLTSAGLTDYRALRRALWPMVRLGRVPARSVGVDGAPEHRVADWLWVHVTRGPVPRSTARTRAAIVLNASLDPELRLHLVSAALAELDYSFVRDAEREAVVTHVIGERA